MIRLLLKKFIARHREIIWQETSFLQDFMHLLMKQRNTGQRWSKEDKRQLKLQLLHLSGYVPALIIFLLPGGSLLLPVLAEILERRKKLQGRRLP